MDLKKEIEAALHNQYGNKGIAGLVQLMQLNYNMRNSAAFVSAIGSVINIDLRNPEMVEAYRTLKQIADNSQSYSFSEYLEAKTQLSEMKKNLSQAAHQTTQDRQFFISAKVSKVTFSIGGEEVASKEIM